MKNFPKWLRENKITQKYGFIYMDGDKLKIFNNTHGKTKTNAFLIAATKIIQKKFGQWADRENGSAGDEWVVLAPIEDLVTKLEQVQEEIKS